MPYPPGVTPEQFLTRNLKGTRTEQGEPLEVNGLPGYTAIAQNVSLPWGNKGPARYAVIYMNNQAFVFFGATRITSALASHDAAAAEQHQDVSPAASAGVRDRRSGPHPGRAGRRRRPRSKGSRRPRRSRSTPAQQLRLLNDLYPDKEPTAGQPIKIVE